MERRVYSHWWLLTKLKIIGTYEKLLGKGIIPKKYFLHFLPDKPIILEAGADKRKEKNEIGKQRTSGKKFFFATVARFFLKIIKKKTKIKKKEKEIAGENKWGAKEGRKKTTSN